MSANYRYHAFSMLSRTVLLLHRSALTSTSAFAAKAQNLVSMHLRAKLKSGHAPSFRQRGGV